MQRWIATGAATFLPTKWSLILEMGPSSSFKVSGVPVVKFENKERRLVGLVFEGGAVNSWAVTYPS